MICKGQVTYKFQGAGVVSLRPIKNATIVLIKEGKRKGDETEVAQTRSDKQGRYTFPDVAAGHYMLRCSHFGEEQEKPIDVVDGQDCETSVDFDFTLQFSILIGDERRQSTFAVAGKRVVIALEGARGKVDVRWELHPEVPFIRTGNEIDLIAPDGPRRLEVGVAMIEQGAEEKAAIVLLAQELPILPAEAQKMSGNMSVKEPVGVRLLRTETCSTNDQILWAAIRNRTRAISFSRYQEFMNRALLWEERVYQVPPSVVDPVVKDRIRRDLNELGTHLHGVRAYHTLKTLTETFLLLECGVRIESEGGRRRNAFEYDEESRLGRPFTLETLQERLRAYLGGERQELPYIERVVRALFPDMEREGWEDRLIATRVNQPCLIELIWCYWHEEGMLAQTMNALCQRFQNVRGAGDRNPLANVEIDPLRPLNNLLWGYIQDEPNRLTVRRRAYEYLHQYGLTLYGKAASAMNAADVRSKFLEAFHNLLYQASVFFKEDYQTTVIADGFPLLNSLKEVHVILAQGAQNQWGDMTVSGRVEMLLMQYMLARREVRDFLQSRAMVPYKEPWEAQVDAMNTLQGWNDTSVGNFRDLAVFGEQILLSIRFGDWIGVINEDSAKNWARDFRFEIYGYLHAYRAVTGIDLTNPDTIDSTIPGILLQRRMAMQRTAR